MSFWLINHSWKSFKRTQKYCGFIHEMERDKIKVGDRVVYFGNSLVLGLFEVIALPDNEFKGWQKPYSFQVKLKSIIIAKAGLLAKPLESKIKLQKSEGGSPNLLKLTENEFNQIMEAIEKGQKELMFK
jgi:hypothetical protein